MKPATFRLAVATLSDPGRIRTLNEDGVVADKDGGFALVADGMGGHRAGDLASRLAVESIVARMQARDADLTPAWVEAAVVDANQTIHTTALQQARRSGMGTTLAMAAFDAQRAILAHVGDSRIYRLRDGHLALLTRDDSMLNDQVEMGLIAATEASDSHNRHFVTQALGMGEQITVHLREEEVRVGDVYLLCTDGLNDLVAESDIEQIIDALKTNLALTATHLVQLANDSGGYDNISVALVRVQDEEIADNRQGWFGRLLGRLLN